jgi:diguanylate cyclase (GGDEF)-like protein
VLVTVLGAGYAVSLVPGVRGGEGYVAALDGWANCLFVTGVIALVLVRATGDRDNRAAWLCFAFGLASWLAGSLGYYLHYQYQEPMQYPSWSDVGWVAFYPLVYVALLLMLRSRLSRPSRSMWLDGLVAGLTAAAYAVAFALGAALRVTDGSFAVVVTNFAYPVADLLLLLLVAGALTVIGRGAGPSWWWLTAGLACFGVTDTVYAFQVARDGYVDGGLVDLGWLLAFACFALATRTQRSVGTSTRLDGMGALVVPGLCSLAALALLFHGYLDTGEPLAGALALGAVLAALARTGLTFAEVRALAESRRQARTDELTGLPNRRRVFEALAAADQRLADGGSFALLLMDLDRFKEVNDSLGHAAGDAVLRLVGPRLASGLRPGDLLARLGGDEFVVLCEGPDEQDAVQLAARLRTLLQQPFAVGAVELTIDATVGIAVGPRDSSSAEELLRLADLAMYSAKARRTGVAVYDDARDGHGRHRLETVEQLRAGMARGELVLHYQPKLDVELDLVTGVEALVRWQHPERGLLYPVAFVDLAEAFGLMSELTRRVLDAALLQCRAWQDAGVHVTVAVNVSPSDLVDELFPNEVAKLLTRYRLPSSSLVLEVTESLLMEDRERAAGVLTRLRDSGVGIAIDDYGTGYSSLAYLAELPVTELKLDRSFIASMTGSRRSTAIVTSTLQLAHALGLVLVAEGVEDQATVEALTELGCDVLQGYHLSRPLPPDQLTAWLEARTRCPRDVTATAAGAPGGRR